MPSPPGRLEPGQRPALDEYTPVLAGRLRVESADGATPEACTRQAVATRAGERVRYSTPEPESAEYVAVGVPAFSPATVHRDPP